MEAKLIAWARAVKARQGAAVGVPPLWVFTDRDRLADPRAILRSAPRGLCGVVLRTNGAFVGDLARLCRQRRFVLVVAGNPGLAARLRVGQHLSRSQRRLGGAARCVTASAHNPAELIQARRLGVRAVFLSPVFSTASHPGVTELGPVRWAGLARRTGLAVLALGGVTAASVRRLPRWCRGAGVVGAAAGMAIGQPPG